MLSNENPKRHHQVRAGSCRLKASKALILFLYGFCVCVFHSQGYSPLNPGPSDPRTPRRNPGSDFRALKSAASCIQILGYPHEIVSQKIDATSHRQQYHKVEENSEVHRLSASVVDRTDPLDKTTNIQCISPDSHKLQTVYYPSLLVDRSMCYSNEGYHGRPHTQQPSPFYSADTFRPVLVDHGSQQQQHDRPLGSASISAPTHNLSPSEQSSVSENRILLTPASWGHFVAPAPSHAVSHGSHSTPYSNSSSLASSIEPSYLKSNHTAPGPCSSAYGDSNLGMDALQLIMDTQTSIQHNRSIGSEDTARHAPPSHMNAHMSSHDSGLYFNVPQQQVTLQSGYNELESIRHSTSVSANPSAAGLAATSGGPSHVTCPPTSYGTLSHGGPDQSGRGHPSQTAEHPHSQHSVSKFNAPVYDYSPLASESGGGGGGGGSSSGHFMVQQASRGSGVGPTPNMCLRTPPPPTSPGQGLVNPEGSVGSSSRLSEIPEGSSLHGLPPSGSQPRYHPKRPPRPPSDRGQGRKPGSSARASLGLTSQGSSDLISPVGERGAVPAAAYSPLTTLNTTLPTTTAAVATNESSETSSINMKKERRREINRKSARTLREKRKVELDCAWGVVDELKAEVASLRGEVRWQRRWRCQVQQSLHHVRCHGLHNTLCLLTSRPCFSFSDLTARD